MNEQEDYETDNALVNLSPEEIRTLNRTLRKGIESKGRYGDTIKENLTILNRSLGILLDKNIFTEDMIPELRITKELIDDLVFLNYYPDIRSKILLSLKLLRDFLDWIEREGKYPEDEKYKKYQYPYYYKYRDEDYDKYGYPRGDFEKIYYKYGKSKTYSELKRWYSNLWRNMKGMRERDIKRMLEANDKELSRDEIGSIEVLAFNDAITELFGGVTNREMRTFSQIRSEREQQSIKYIREKLRNTVQYVESLSDDTIAQLSKTRDLDEIFNKISEGIIKKGMK